MVKTLTYGAKRTQPGCCPRIVEARDLDADSSKTKMGSLQPAAETSNIIQLSPTPMKQRFMYNQSGIYQPIAHSLICCPHCQICEKIVYPRGQ